MFSKRIVCILLACLLSAAGAQEAVPTDQAAAPAPEQPDATEQQQSATQPPADAAPGVKTLSGMSILGNEEAPKSLVIVPWKSSEIGDGVGVEDLIDARARPVDKEVFLREVRYFQLRTDSGE